jgi:predicted phosphoribosyltransferase
MEQYRSDGICKNRIFDAPQYRNRTRIFQDRQDAADALAKLLPTWLIRSNPVLMAISDAGYLLAGSLAERFGLDIEFTPVQRVVLPWDKEIDYAAVAFDGTVYLDHEMVNHTRLGKGEIDKGIARAIDCLSRDSMLSSSLSVCRIKNRSVLLVDEGVTTCAAACAAIKSLKVYRSKRPSLALTTAYDRALLKLAPSFRHIFCTNIRSGFSYAPDDAYKQPVADATIRSTSLQNAGRAQQLIASQ